MGKSYNTDKRDKYNKFKRIKRIKPNKDTFKNHNKWICECTEDV